MHFLLVGFATTKSWPLETHSSRWQFHQAKKVLNLHSKSFVEVVSVMSCSITITCKIFYVALRQLGAKQMINED